MRAFGSAVTQFETIAIGIESSSPWMISTGALTRASSAVQFQSPREPKVAGFVFVIPKRIASGGAAQRSDFTTVTLVDFAKRGGVMIDQYSRQAAVISEDFSNPFCSSSARLRCSSVSLFVNDAPYSSKNLPFTGGIGERKIIRSTFSG